MWKGSVLMVRPGLVQVDDVGAGLKLSTDVDELVGLVLFLTRLVIA